MSEGGDRPNVASEEALSNVIVTERSLRNLTRLLLKAINQPTNPACIRKADLPAAIDISKARVNGILNPGSQKSNAISLEEIGKVVLFGRKFAQTLSDERYRELISGYCNEIAQRLHDHLERAGLSPTENSFVTNLRLLDDSDQQSFSDKHAGVYALIRYDRDGDILISRMDIRERENQLCQFATDSGAAGASEPMVEGYIFAVGDWIQAVGRPRSATGLRHSILRSHRQPGSARWDMIGLRLGNSTYDGGPFAYRIFCRKLADAKTVGKEMDGWADLFGARRFAAIERVEETIDDIGAILLLLEEAEAKDSQTPWGIRMPTGISSGDA